MAAPSRSTTSPWHLNTKRQGIASRLLEQCLADLKAQGIVGFHLITAHDGVLPAFHEKFDFKKEELVMLMGME